MWQHEPTATASANEAHLMCDVCLFPFVRVSCLSREHLHILLRPSLSTLSAPPSGSAQRSPRPPARPASPSPSPTGRDYYIAVKQGSYCTNELNSLAPCGAEWARNMNTWRYKDRRSSRLDRFLHDVAAVVIAVRREQGAGWLADDNFGDGGLEPAQRPSAECVKMGSRWMMWHARACRMQSSQGGGEDRTCCCLARAQSSLAPPAP